MAADAEGLFAAHHQQLFRYLCRAVGHADVARDLTQDVFVRVCRSSVPEAPALQVKAWLFQIARNLALDHHRKGLTRAEGGAMPEQVRPGSQHTSLVVNEALAMLSPLDRDVFLMREVAGLSYDEIAQACELTPDRVRNGLHRTRLQLREWLQAPITARKTRSMRLALHHQKKQDP